MWKPWLWRPNSQETAVRNARHASAVLAQRRSEREEVEAFLSARSMPVTPTHVPTQRVTA